MRGTIARFRRSTTIRLSSIHTLIKPITPLHGLPISIEENIDTKNMDRTAGFVVGRVDKLRMMCMFRSYCGMLAMCSTHER